MLRSMSAPTASLQQAIAAAGSRRAAGDFSGALIILAGLLQNHPGDRSVLLALARTGAAMGGREEALALLDAALLTDPGAGELRLERGALLEQLGRIGEAEAALRALGADPIAMLRLSYLQRRLGKYAEARASARFLTDAHPGFAPGWTSLGISLYTEGDLAAAAVSFDRAIALDPDDPVAQFSRATCLLAAGRWRDGFAGFAWRRRFPDAIAAPAGLPERRGGERGLLIWNDQGLGDAIQFLRYVPLLRRSGVETTVRLPPSLVRLARTVPGIGPVLSTDDPLPPADAHLPLMDVPAVLGLDDIPAASFHPADPDDRFAALPGLKVGLVWAGDARTGDFQANALDRRRSLAPDDLAPLLAVPGASFVSLQFGAPPLPGTVGAMEGVTDFADTAALVAALDLVITVDTSVAHLAGAMGKPVWILSRYDGCWRWLRERAESPWYPSARLFRQTEPGDWASVVADVAASLGERIASIVPP